MLATAEQRLSQRDDELRRAVERAESAETGDEEDLEREQLAAAAAKDRAEAAARAAREAETEARLALRGLEEQQRHAASRAEAQARAARSERAAQAEAARRAERRRVQARVALAVATAAEHLRARAEEATREAAAERDEIETRRAGLDEAAQRLRAERDEVTKDLAQITEKLHRAELDLAQRRARLEGLETTALEELGLTPDFLVDHYGPHLPVPDADAVLEEAQRAEEEDTPRQLELPKMTDPGAPFRREEQEARLQRAQKQLKALGKVNPLALEEFAALEERHTFLVTQLEDVKNSRTDLRNIIRDVDRHVEEVFTQAYRDTAEQFVSVFATLFPGGEGRLRLTDPDDMLNSGVEVEARPAGKKIKRLSLLSGGERSLTAIALLVAIFKARPSPFYVMDEVEAALDDRNLGRLLTIFEQLKESSQLIIVTHQKRTMEIADALYGVSMRGDGVSLVVGSSCRSCGSDVLLTTAPGHPGGRRVSPRRAGSPWPRGRVAAVWPRGGSPRSPRTTEAQRRSSPGRHGFHRRSGSPNRPASLGRWRPAGVRPSPFVTLSPCNGKQRPNRRMRGARCRSRPPAHVLGVHVRAESS